MVKCKKIAKSVIVKNSKIESENITINSRVKLENVHIKAKKITIDSDSILIGCKIFSEGEITIGKRCLIKEQSMINAFRGIKIGARCIIDRNVIIGGMQSEQSEIELGDDCAILYGSYLNPTKKISLGNNVGIGGYSLIFTHSAWQNVLLGHPNKFGEVIVEDNVWIPWNVIILPGIRIGENTVIGTGSVVTKDIPPNVFAAGNPATIKRKNNKNKIPSRTEKNNLVLNIINEFHKYAQGFLKLPNKIHTTNSLDNVKSTVTKNRIQKYTIVSFKDSQLVYSPTINKIPKITSSVIVSFKISTDIKSQKKCQWIELDTLKSNITSNTGKNFASFIKRYGIRLKV